MDFKNAKRLGGIGVLIMAFGGIPTLLINRFSFNTNIINYILDMNISSYIVTLIVGMVLILISMYNLSKFYQAKKILTLKGLGVGVYFINGISFGLS